AVWNCRGLGGPSTVSQIKEIFRSHHPHFFFLSETRNSSFFVKSVAKKLGFVDRHALVDPVGLSGGLLLLWSPEIVIVQLITNSCFIAVEFSMANGEVSWAIFVYLSACASTRIDQWKLLEDEKHKWKDKWFIIGDWNDIRSNSKKLGGSLRNGRSLAGFNNFINSMVMEEIKMTGCKFTWCNHRSSEGLIQEKLDRGFGSLDWLQNFPNASTLSVSRSASDHSLLLRNTGTLLHKAPRRFHFDKRWLLKDEVFDIVNAVWSHNQTGTPFFQLKEKIKLTKIALIKWSAKFKTDNQSKIEHLNSKLELLRNSDLASNWEDWVSTKADLDQAYHSEELECTSQQDIQNHITSFYANLFSSEGSWGGDSILHLIQLSISSDMNQDLLKPFLEEEIKDALF
ncbi:Unknown protein, partial [Striga hermonthica]